MIPDKKVKWMEDLGEATDGDEMRKHLGTFGNTRHLSYWEYGYIKLKHVFWIRWLSMGEAIEGVLRNHRDLAVYTEEKAADGDPTSSGYTSS
ncbi:Hypp6209 [Branchiostoma lanceolatum]|uniref:Hypp6209 protein n=1 Tax=Branchiostoma lanceolatum TaxID=7740 RepID=A0A8J9WI05_BRALA|nr:Hypp6209 [Branchiostoma lanceolatum]